MAFPRSRNLLVLGTLTLSAAACSGGNGSPSGSNGNPVSPSTPNRAPVINSMNVSPGFGISQLTSFALTASATDPDGDAMSYSWDFGDGTTGSGNAFSKTYGGSGVVTIRLTVTDSKGSAASDSRTATVGSAAGAWSGNVTLSATQRASFTMNLTQNGGVVTGTMILSGANGRSDPAQPGTLSSTGAFELRMKVDPFSDVTMRGTMDATGRTISGGFFGSGFNGQSFTMSK